MSDVSQKAREAVRPSKLDELNRAFRCAYIECPAHVIDDLKRRFDEFLEAALLRRAIDEAEWWHPYHHPHCLGCARIAALKAELEKLEGK